MDNILCYWFPVAAIFGDGGGVRVRRAYKFNIAESK